MSLWNPKGSRGEADLLGALGLSENGETKLFHEVGFSKMRVEKWWLNRDISMLRRIKYA